jgi:hypothetical protein
MSFNVPRLFLCDHCGNYTHDNYYEARVPYEERHSQVCPSCGELMTYCVAATRSFVAGRSYDLDPPDRV